MFRSRSIYAGLIVGVVVFTSFAWLVVAIREPRYEGRSASEWLQEASTNQNNLREYGEVFLQWGDEGAAFLVKRLASRPSPVSQRLLGVYNRLAQHLPLPLVRSSRGVPDRRVARRLLGYFGEDAAPILVAALHRYSGDNRAEVIRAMGELGPGAMDIVGPHLLPLINDPVPAVAYESITTLAVIGYAPERVVPLLLPLLQHTNQRFRVEASYALGSYPPMPEVTFEALRSALGDSETTVRANSLRALGKMGERARPAGGQVIQCLEDDMLVQARAIEALPFILDSTTLNSNDEYQVALGTAWSEHGYYYERMMFCRARMKLGMNADGFEEICRRLIRSASNWQVWETVEAMAEMDPRPDWANELLREAARHPNGLVRLKANRALGVEL